MSRTFKTSNPFRRLVAWHLRAPWQVHAAMAGMLLVAATLCVSSFQQAVRAQSVPSITITSIPNSQDITGKLSLVAKVNGGRATEFFFYIDNYALPATATTDAGDAWSFPAIDSTSFPPGAHLIFATAIMNGTLVKSQEMNTRFNLQDIGNKHRSIPTPAITITDPPDGGTMNFNRPIITTIHGGFPDSGYVTFKVDGKTLGGGEGTTLQSYGQFSSNGDWTSSFKLSPDFLKTKKFSLVAEAQFNGKTIDSPPITLNLIPPSQATFGSPKGTDLPQFCQTYTNEVIPFSSKVTGSPPAVSYKLQYAFPYNLNPLNDVIEQMHSPLNPPTLHAKYNPALGYWETTWDAGHAKPGTYLASIEITFGPNGGTSNEAKTFFAVGMPCYTPDDGKGFFSNIFFNSPARLAVVSGIVPLVVSAPTSTPPLEFEIYKIYPDPPTHLKANSAGTTWSANWDTTNLENGFYTIKPMVIDAHKDDFSQNARTFDVENVNVKTPASRKTLPPPSPKYPTTPKTKIKLKTKPQPESVHK